VPIVLKSGILNLLETSGPVLACTGIAFPFSLLLSYLNAKHLTRVQQFIASCNNKAFAQNLLTRYKNDDSGVSSSAVHSRHLCISVLATTS